jgi:hypothetical protein
VFKLESMKIDVVKTTLELVKSAGDQPCLGRIAAAPRKSPKVTLRMYASFRYHGRRSPRPVTSLAA